MSLIDLMTLWLLAIAFVTSALGGLLGMASGVFIVPLLVMTDGITIQTAIGASLVSVIACSCASAPHFLRSGLVNIRLAVVLEIASTAGALTGVFLMGIVSTATLYLLFAAVMLASAWQMFANRHSLDTSLSTERSTGWEAHLRLNGQTPASEDNPSRLYIVQRLPLGMSLMYAAGVLSALLGIGSGVLKIPAMDSALRLPIKISSATSNFMIGITAAAGALAYYVRGDIDINIAGPVAMGSVVGAMLGARMMSRVPERQLRILFVAILLLLAVQMTLEGLGLNLYGKA